MITDVLATCLKTFFAFSIAKNPLVISAHSENRQAATMAAWWLYNPATQRR